MSKNKVVKVKRGGTAKEAAAQKKRLYIDAMIANGGNQRQAALTAGATTVAGADQWAHRMSKDVMVVKELHERREEMLRNVQMETGISVSRTLREIARLAYADLAKCFDKDGNALEMHEIPEEARAAIAGFEMEELFVGRGEARQHVGSTKKFKFHSKPHALDMLMKHLGEYEKDNAQKPTATLAPTFILVPVRAAPARD